MEDREFPADFTASGNAERIGESVCHTAERCLPCTRCLSGTCRTERG